MFVRSNKHVLLSEKWCSVGEDTLSESACSYCVGVGMIHRWVPRDSDVYPSTPTCTPSPSLLPTPSSSPLSPPHPFSLVVSVHSNVSRSSFFLSVFLSVCIPFFRPSFFPSVTPPLPTLPGAQKTKQQETNKQTKNKKSTTTERKGGGGGAGG